jgi:hypothetical protein
LGYTRCLVRYLEHDRPRRATARLASDVMRALSKIHLDSAFNISVSATALLLLAFALLCVASGYYSQATASLASVGV